jgi:hypothetical protein
MLPSQYTSALSASISGEKPMLADYFYERNVREQIEKKRTEMRKHFIMLIHNLCFKV